MKKLILAAIATAAALTGTAQAATFTGQLTAFDPEFTRPNTHFPGMPAALAANYDLVTFNVGTAGNYTLFLDDYPAPQVNFDPVLYLYSGSFNPHDPTANLIGANNNYAQIYETPLSLDYQHSRISASLLAETSYIAVITNWSGLQQLTNTDRWRLQINGPGAVNPGPFNPPSIDPGSPGTPGAVPEPATWAMLILGFGMVGSVARRRRQTQVLS